MPGPEEVVAVQLAAKHGIHVDSGSIRRNSSGLDFDVFFAQDREGRDWVLRVPRRDDVPPRARQERQTLSFIREFVSCETPDFQVCADDLVAYETLSGTPAGVFTAEVQNYVWGGPGTAVPQNFTESLATTLAELHQIPSGLAVTAGVPATQANNLRHAMDERMHRVRAVFGVEPALWSRWQEWVQHEEMWPREAGLIHGDLHPGHLLVDSDVVVTGILDWTEAKVEDVSSDFVYHYLAFGEGELSSLLTAYEASGGLTWPLMTEHVMELAAAFPVLIAEFALTTQTEELETVARQALGVGMR